MNTITPNDKVANAKSPMRYDIVQIMRDGFELEQLNQIVAALTEDGNHCTVFDRTGIRGALANPKTKLLLITVATGETSELIKLLRPHASGRDVPLLVYFSSPENQEETFGPQIDDFLMAPLNLRDLCLRVKRLKLQFPDDEQHVDQTLVSHNGRDEVTEAQQRLTAHLGAQQFIGSAPSFWATIEKIPRVASCDATVLLVGDTGTGKELCARAVHYFGARASKPFVPINCGSMPSELFENELFGHEQGAFTDARQSRRGLIAEAEGGTLFFDEVDSLPLSAQVKLLRFLQERQYRPLGGHYRRADVRVIAATNQNLPAKVQSGAFREDLFYRLKVVTLHLPPLRERQEDILPLAIHFLKTSAHEYKRTVMELSAGAMHKLTSYTWPGNVRELENVIRQAVVLASGPTIRARDLQFEIEVPEVSEPVLGESFQTAKARLIEEFERAYLENALVASAGNISKAARHARKDRRSFFALLKKHSLVPSQRGLSESQSAAVGC